MIGKLIEPAIKEMIEEQDFAALRATFKDWAPADLAEMLGDLPEDEQVLLFRIFPHDVASLTFEYLGLEAQKHLLRAMGHERKAACWVGYSLYALVGYVLLNSAYGLFVVQRVTDTHESVWGIAIGLIAKIGMPILAGYKLSVAARLNSPALRADAMEAITCSYLSIVLMVGLAATRLFGWWWLDSVAALALIPFLVREGRAAIRDEGECC